MALTSTSCVTSWASLWLPQPRSGIGVSVALGQPAKSLAVARLGGQDEAWVATCSAFISILHGGKGPSEKPRLGSGGHLKNQTGQSWPAKVGFSWEGAS